MPNFFDANLVIALVNLSNTVGNVYWGTKLKAIQTNHYIVEELQEEITELQKQLGNKERLLLTYKAARDREEK